MTTTICTHPVITSRNDDDQTEYCVRCDHVLTADESRGYLGEIITEAEAAFRKGNGRNRIPLRPLPMYDQEADGRPVGSACTW